MLREELVGFDVSGRDFEKDNSLGSVEWSNAFLSTLKSRTGVAAVVTLPDSILIGEITLDRVLAESSFTHWGRQLVLDFQDSHTTMAEHKLNIFQLDGQMVVGDMIAIEGVEWSVLVSQNYETAFRQLRTVLAVLGAGLFL